jgi:exopolyphosphatase/pppGpp-phosphohydrolase
VTTAAALVLAIDDRSTTLARPDIGELALPIGPLSLLDDQLGRVDPPGPVELTNALGAVHDRLEDVAIEAPDLLDSASVVAVGPHAVALARVERGLDVVPDPCRLERADVDEVFRTLVGETAIERAHNPGLAPDHVETVIPTCCIVLALVRRLDLDHVVVEQSAADRRRGR